jgi:hypothetical protein
MNQHAAEYTEMAQERAGGLRLIRRVLVVLAVAVALNIGFGAWQFVRVGAAVRDNCQNVHLLVVTLDKILASGDAQTERYVREGLLTREQADRAGRYRAEQRDVLAGADCPARNR